MRIACGSVSICSPASQTLKAKGCTNNSMPDRRKPFLIENKPLYCKLGVHRWDEPHLLEIVNKNIEEWEKRCLACNEVKRWTKHKSHTFKK